MKKSIIRLLLLLLFTNVIAQKTIENPIHGFTTLPGNITQIEFLDDTTIISFHIKYKPGNWIFIPKETFIKDVNSDEKMFVTKAEGIPLRERYTMPESGEVHYKLFFPEINKDVAKIDFGEANNGGNWYVYDILVNEEMLPVKIPKALLGNWLKTDGSNQWEYSFLHDKAIIDKTVWYYKDIATKKRRHTITLENDGAIKTIYAKVDKNGQVKIGKNKKTLVAYSNQRTNNPDYKLKNDTPFETSIFKNDSTTYSGIIKGYAPRIGESTAMVYVNNPFIGNQETYLINIADNGTFSVKFPLRHPQFVLFRGAGANVNVFVEPGKETFHYVSKDENLFMGDHAQINSDLMAMKSINYFDYRKVMEDILTVAPEDFKNRINDIKDRELADLENFTKKEFVSQKARQLKKMDIEISAITNILSYDIKKRSALRYAQQKKNKKDSIPVSDYKIDASYYSVVSKELLDDPMAIMASQYYFFINRLMYAEIFRDNSRLGTTSFTTVELAEKLKEQGVELTPEEQKMVEASKAIQTKEIQNRRKEFNAVYQEAFLGFLRKNTKVLNGIMMDENKSADLVASLEAEGIELSSDNKEMLRAYSKVTSPEDNRRGQLFKETYGETLRAFSQKYRTNISSLYSQERDNALLKKMQDYFAVEEAFVFDVIKLQQCLRDLHRNMTPFTDAMVAKFQQPIKNPFLADYVEVENNRMKTKIQANKNKEGYAVNKVEKSEGDELFQSMVKKFKGKVVYVDFWATWCGPCKSGIRRIKPLKEEMKDDDVVFLYITGPSSPETTWKNSIPDIKGEHYRVTKDEWNYLVDKFKITGIPHYALVNKKGTVIKGKMRRRSNSQLKTLLREEIAK